MGSYQTWLVREPVRETDIKAVKELLMIAITGTHAINLHAMSSTPMAERLKKICSKCQIFRAELNVSYTHSAIGEEMLKIRKHGGDIGVTDLN